MQNPEFGFTSARWQAANVANEQSSDTLSQPDVEFAHHMAFGV